MTSVTAPAEERRWAPFKDSLKVQSYILEIARRLLKRVAGLRAITPTVMGAGFAVLMAAEAGYQRQAHVFDHFRDAYEASSTVLLMSGVVFDLESAQREYFRSADRSSLRSMQRARKRLPTFVLQLRSNRTTHPILLTRIEGYLDRQLAAMDALPQSDERGRIPRADRAVREQEVHAATAALKGSVRDLQKYQQWLAASYERDWNRDLVLLRATLLIAVASSVFLLVFILRLVRRRMRAEHQYAQLMEDEKSRLDTLVAERTAELTELANHLQSVREQEKANLARELHDELGAILTAIRMDLAWVRRDSALLRRTARSRLQHALQILDRAIALKVRIIEGMLPSALTNLGLVSALETLSQDLASRSDLAVICDLDVKVQPDRDTAIALYRVVQESLTNIGKHAQARAVNLTLACEGRAIRLCIEDDGIGIAAEALEKGGAHGIAGIRQRVMALKGRLAIRSAPGKGTRIDVEVPLQA